MTLGHPTSQQLGTVCTKQQPDPWKENQLPLVTNLQPGSNLSAESLWINEIVLRVLPRLPRTRGRVRQDPLPAGRIPPPGSGRRSAEGDAPLKLLDYSG